MRILSDKFMDAFLNGGQLNPMLKRIWADDTLDMEIREDYVNIYYRGGNLIRITRKNSDFKFFFDQKYSKNNLLSLPSAPDVAKWIEKIPAIKEAMDKYFTAQKKEEREFQQLVVRENNSSTIANGTDYFIIDIEYDNHDKKNRARFDLVALKWESDGQSRRNIIGKPHIAFIEMKYGDGALTGKSGMVEHLIKFQEFVRKGGVPRIINEMSGIFKQKRELSLIPSLRHNRNPITANAISPNFEYIFLLANHDPASTKLAAALNEIDMLGQSGTKNVKPLFCAAIFLGYGLYKETILSLNEFQNRLNRQIHSK